MRSPPDAAFRLWTTPLYALFDSLGSSAPPRPADCIFVFAGRPERKRYGIELWNLGFAPRLVLSVGRFEWRSVPELGLPDGGLASLAPTIPPGKRHFFLVLDSEGARARAVEVGGPGTWAEARALADTMSRERHRSVLVVSSFIHLRRATMVVRRRMRAPGIAVEETAVPEAAATIRRQGWWSRRMERDAVLLEAVKLALYWLRLRLPW
ncbi:MAG: YdcF family protein [Candidatus Latescibacteria bacterium]|nr:YdcF family protein [Candidatus Latescibacterota bacterium]